MDSQEPNTCIRSKRICTPAAPEATPRPHEGDRSCAFAAAAMMHTPSPRPHRTLAPPLLPRASWTTSRTRRSRSSEASWGGPLRNAVLRGVMVLQEDGGCEVVLEDGNAVNGTWTMLPAGDEILDALGTRSRVRRGARRTASPYVAHARLYARGVVIFVVRRGVSGRGHAARRRVVRVVARKFVSGRPPPRLVVVITVARSSARGCAVLHDTTFPALSIQSVVTVRGSDGCFHRKFLYPASSSPGSSLGTLACRRALTGTNAIKMT